MSQFGEYKSDGKGNIEVSFESMPEEIRSSLRNNGFKQNRDRQVWHAEQTPQRLNLAKKICGNLREEEELRPYGLKLKIKDILCADDKQIAEWVSILEKYICKIMHKAQKSGTKKPSSQVESWRDCFDFIQKNLAGLDSKKQEFEMIFEYSLPETYHHRPDVLILTVHKVICLEFKRKDEPQHDNKKDDVTQVWRYIEQLGNHHKMTQDFGMEVKGFLVCTQTDERLPMNRGIEILTAKNFGYKINELLYGDSPCDYIDTWLNSPRTEMPDMIRAIRALYHDGKIPYVSDVNKNCLDQVERYIDDAKTNHKKILIFINGIPGAGKTAVAQTVVFEENKHGRANAVYLAGNGALIEVLQYEIGQAMDDPNAGENVVHLMKNFSEEYFDKKSQKDIPEQYILVFDEAQRAWDAKKANYKHSEPMELLDVGDRIHRKKSGEKYAVVVALYGDGQFVEKEEENSLALWDEAIKEHDDWDIVVSDKLSYKFPDVEGRKIVDYDMYLSTSVRADFVNYTEWVEQAIGRENVSFNIAKQELEKIQNTSFQIFVTRDANEVEKRKDYWDQEYPEWNYGYLISNFIVTNVVQKALKGWTFGKNGENGLWFNAYGPWYTDECKKLNKACSVYGNQGLELDCPIIVFGGDYIRKNREWITNVENWKSRKYRKKDLAKVVENNYRVLLTRARKEMILLIPDDESLDETYQYFVDMGVDKLEDVH